MLTIFTDTDTDITPAIANEYGIKLISMPYIKDNKLIYPYVDFVEYDHAKYFEVTIKSLSLSLCVPLPAFSLTYFFPPPKYYY